MTSDEQIIEAITALRADGTRADLNTIADRLGVEAATDLEMRLLRLTIDERIDQRTWANRSPSYWPPSDHHGFDLDRFTEDDDVKAEFDRLRADPREIRAGYARTDRAFDDAEWSLFAADGVSDEDIAWLAVELISRRRKQ